MLEAVDLLYIILAVAVALLAIFFSIVLVYAIFILRDINKATDAIRDSAEKVHTAVIKPLKMTGEILKYAKPVVEVVEERLKKESKKCSTKKKSTKKSTKKK